MSQIKPRAEYHYEAYLYSEPYFLLLEDESIIDINLNTNESPDSRKYIDFHYNDPFFDFNLRGRKRDTFSIVVITHNRTGQFLQQMDLLGEDLVVECSNRFRFSYEQITTNGAFASINPQWVSAIDVYKKERVSYLRDKKIDTLLR